MAAFRISEYEPWDTFDEQDPFVYLMKDLNTVLSFSFLGATPGQCGIACYVGEQAYAAARQRLFGPNPKKEPVFYLQTAIIGLWGNREDVSPTNYRIIKDLNFPFRGKGAWLHFEAYEPGYLPRPLNSQELDLMISGLGNLFMMVKGLHETNLLDLFTQGEFPLRIYSPEDNLYHIHRLPMNLLPPVDHPRFTVHEDSFIQHLQAVPKRAYSLELDWSYLPTIIKEGRTKFFPRMILATDAASGFVHCSNLMGPGDDPEIVLLNSLSSVIEENGKPKKLYVCEPELEARLADFCQKIGLPIVTKKRLQQTDRARKFITNSMKDSE